MKTIKSLPDAEDLRAYFRYDPSTGTISGPRGTCGYINSRGYVVVKYKSRPYLAHRVIWKIVHGVDPLIIDHINENRSDNRIVNLRNCRHRDNLAYAATPKRKDGLPTGVRQLPSGRYRAKYTVGCKYINVGTFDTAEEAEKARTEAMKKAGL
jgi:hypothetical protein